MLSDSGSFLESQKYVTCRSTSFGLDRHRIPGDGVVSGCAMIDGREVWISAQDFTVLGGSLGEMHAQRDRRRAEFRSQYEKAVHSDQ